MGSHQEENDFTSVIDDLVNMFGQTLTREVIMTVVESCEGDLNLSVDAIMKITNDGNTIQDEKHKEDGPSTSNNIKDTSYSQQSISYASYAAQNKGAIPRPVQRPTKSAQDFWTDQIRDIMSYHNQGSRIMVLMRGVPGSGKSYLAKLLVESLVGPSFANYKNHILSTDDYFMVRGQYQFDKYKLSNAHAWNHIRVRQVANQGLSPIIIDNTNIEVWEMHPYVTEGVKNGYIIEVVEPTTSWAKKANQLFKKNIHNVPLNTIKRMLDNYCEGVTGESLRNTFRLSYPENMVPPVKRLVPPVEVENTYTSMASALVQNSTQVSLLPISEQNISAQPLVNMTHSVQAIEENITTVNIPTENLVAISSEDQKEQQQELDATYNEVDDLTQEEQAKQNFLLEAQKRLEELEKFEQEWENGEEWNDNDKEVSVASAINTRNILTTTTAAVASSSIAITSASPENATPLLIGNFESKPPRKDKNVAEINRETNNVLMKSVNECQDWRDISLFMPPWDVSDVMPNISVTQKPPIETTTSSTCVEGGDTSPSRGFKIISAVSRDINEFYIPPEREKIPEQRMFDKSTMTNEGIVMTINCPQKEKHFAALRRAFTFIERESLRFIFDHCCGDVNWAVENVLGGKIEYQLKDTENAADSDVEEETDVSNDLPCTCLAKYGIIPNIINSDALAAFTQKNNRPKVSGDPVPQIEKKKRDVAISEENMELKRQIEQNVKISDSHYSEHCLKIRKLRRGEYSENENISEQPSTSGTQITAETAVPTLNDAMPEGDNSDDEYCYNSDISEGDKIVNVNVGSAFINDLDQMFGREDMIYPEEIKFNISIPTSLLNEINALWMESMMFQLDEFAKKSAQMVKQDEEFARQIAMKEEELLLAGKEPGVPDLKEIMDLELAISIHMKDMSEWKNNIPTDLAAKMTHEKLFNLFPEIDKDTLLEMLMAHDNNFKTTVEVLLMSMGRGDLLEKENGLNKFVMEKELERQEKMLEEQRKQLTQVEWPPLPKGEKVEMSTIQGFREEAEKHLNRRNLNMQKAEEYIRRGMTQVANYYSEIANFHKTKYEQANSMAVASLMQYHANKSPDSHTVDLHYFRVKEAKETMDIFIDTHIHRLREANRRGNSLFFITGRGLHSPGRPKIKPACIKRLRERGLHHIESNPGLLRVRISCDDKLTYQVP